MTPARGPLAIVSGGINDPGHRERKLHARARPTARSLNVPPSRLSHLPRMNLRAAVFLPSAGILRLSETSFFRMKLSLRTLFTPLAVVLAAALTTAPLLAKSDAGNVTTSVGRLLEEGHYTHQALNDEVSKKFLKTYLELLDFSHLFFTQQDVDMLTSKYGTSLDDDVLLGNLKPPYEIYDLYTKRVDDRVGKIKEQLNQPQV